MKHTLHNLQWLLLLPAMILPITATPTQNTGETPSMPGQNQQKDDNMLAACRERIINVLVTNGIISPENGKAIAQAAIINTGKNSVQVRHENGKLVFDSSAATLLRLQQEHSKDANPNQGTAEAYIDDVSKAIATADLLLKLGNHSKQLESSIDSGWRDCVLVSVQNLLLQKNVDYNSAVQKSAIPGVQKYVTWDEKLKAFRFKDAEFAKDIEKENANERAIEELLSDDAGDAAPETVTQASDKGDENPYADKYPGIPKAMRQFWYNLKPLENKTDTTGFHNTVKAIAQNLTPQLSVVPGQPYQPIPFEKLSADQAQKGNNWYTGATAHVRVSSDSVRFYHEVIVPKYGAFLKALSTEVAVHRIKGTISLRQSEYSLRYNRPKDFKNRGSWIYFLTADEPESLFCRKNGATVNLKMTVYYLPEVFSKYYTTPKGKEEYITARLYDADGNNAGTCRSSFFCEKYWIERAFAKDLSFDDICLEEGITPDKTQFTIETKTPQISPEALSVEYENLEIEQPAASDGVEYVGIPQAMQDFWLNLELPENNQDLEWFKKFTAGVNEHTQTQYIIKSASPYKQTSFGLLSSEEAKRSRYWFTGASATLEVSPEYIRFYKEVIIPKYHEVLSFFADYSYTENIQAEVGYGKLDYKNKIKWPDGVFGLYLPDIDAPEKILNASIGDLVDLKVSIYRLPDAFKNYFVSYEQKKVTCYAHATDTAGKHIITTDQYFYSNWIWLSNDFRTSVNFASFYIHENDTGEASQEYEKTIISMRDKWDTFGLERPAPPISIEESAENAFLTIIITIVTLWLLSIPYMGWILYRENKRRWKALELPEDYEVPQGCVFDVEGLRDEFNELREIWDNMERENVDGVEVRYFTLKKEIDKGYAALAKFKGISDLSDDEKYALNAFGSDLNNAQSRILGCEKKQFVIICSICASAGFITNFVAWAIPFVYYLALLTPRYKTDNPEPWYLLLMHRLLYGLGIGMFVAAACSARGDFDTVYVDKYGRLYKDLKDKPVGCAMAACMLMLALFLAPFLIMAQCLIHFIRNYISNR